MTPSEAAAALAKIDALWPEAVLTDELRATLMRGLGRLDIDGEQFAAIADDLRLNSRYRTPDIRELMQRCRAAQPMLRGKAVVAKSHQWRETPEFAAEVDGHNARTLAWVRGLTDDEIAAAFAALERATRGAWKPAAQTRAHLERSEFTRGMLYAACEAATTTRGGEGAGR